MKRARDMAALAEFDGPDALLGAARSLRDAGYTDLDAFTPFEIEALDEVLELKRTRLPWVGLVGGLAGAAFAYLLMWWINVIDYPLNVGGRPLHSGPAFIPITFETAILGASTLLFLGFFWRAGLPELWHPVFEIDGFERASLDRYWLGVARSDPLWEMEDTLTILRETDPLRVVALDEAGEVARDDRLREDAP